MSFIFQLQDVKFTCKRKGGTLSRGLSHNEWSQTVQLEPDVISMSFIPISSLLSGLHGSGFLSHAINLYLRCKYELSSYFALISFYLAAGTLFCIFNCYAAEPFDGGEI